jgi:hypothetical protein
MINSLNSLVPADERQKKYLDVFFETTVTVGTGREG